MNVKPIWGIPAIGVLIAIGSMVPAPAPGPTQAAALSCKTDWTKCADNADMANNFKGWFDVKYDCWKQAADMAKYGTPEFPSLFYFSSFRPGTDFSTGKVTVIENDAKYQNGFGAMARSRVVCDYDLNTHKVINVKIDSRG